MRLAPVSVLVGAFALAVVGCKKDRSEVAPSVAETPTKIATPSASATGEELCSAKSTCPNEPVDEEGNALCASLARDPTCGEKFRALVRCQIAKEKCGADGKIDQTTTLELCKLEDTALNECNQTKAKSAK